MSNWPKDTTKGDGMTNKELADAMERQPVNTKEFVLHAMHAIERLRMLPDPTPEPVKDLRWLVGRHECLSSVIRPYRDPTHGRILMWRDDTDPEWTHLLNSSRALTVVRGIVKAMCHGQSNGWNANSSQPIKGKWYYFSGGQCHYFNTELEAIDALLTAMKGKPC